MGPVMLDHCCVETRPVMPLAKRGDSFGKQDGAEPVLNDSWNHLLHNRETLDHKTPTPGPRACLRGGLAPHLLDHKAKSHIPKSPCTRPTLAKHKVFLSPRSCPPPFHHICPCRGEGRRSSSEGTRRRLDRQGSTFLGVMALAEKSLRERLTKQWKRKDR